MKIQGDQIVKHIVLVIGNYKNGGVAMRSTNLANAFAQKGYHVIILVRKFIGQEVYFEHHDNVKVVQLSEYIKKHSQELHSFNKKLQKRTWLYKKLRYITRFFPKLDGLLANEIRQIRKGDQVAAYAWLNRDSVFIPFGFPCYEATVYAAKKFHCPIIYAEKNAPEIEFPSDIVDKATIAKELAKANGVVCQTQAGRDFFGDLLKNAVVINNPVKADLPERYEGERRKVIVNFCRISKQKNLPLLFEAAVEFHKDYPEFTFEIYGNTVETYEEELRDEYIKLIDSLGASSYIKLLPPSKKVHTLIRDCAMFVSTSDFEGLSNSMIEAMAIGLPCICTDCLGGGAREVIQDGVNGLLVPMKDARALYLAMKKMVQEPEFAEMCSKQATTINQDLALETISNKWLEFITNVI